MSWKKSSYCRFDSPQCVEVQGLMDDYIQVRNSRSPQTITSFDRAEWAAFIDGAKAGDFDLEANLEADAVETTEQD